MRGCIPGTNIKQHIGELVGLENPYTEGSVLLESAKIPSIVIVLKEPPSWEFERTMQGIAQVNSLPISIAISSCGSFLSNNSLFYTINADGLFVDKEELGNGKVKVSFTGIPSDLLLSDKELNNRFLHDYIPTILKARAMMTKRWRGQGFREGVRENVYLHLLRIGSLVLRMTDKVDSLKDLFSLSEESELFNPVALFLMARLHDVGEIFSLLGDIPAGIEHQGLLKVIAEFLEREAIVRLVQNNIIPVQAVDLFDAFEYKDLSSKWGFEAVLCRFADRFLGMRFFDENTIDLTQAELNAEVELRIVDDKVIIFAGDRVLMPLEDLELSKEAIYVD